MLGGETDVGRTLDLLTDAAEHLSLVRLRRFPPGADRVDGFVLATEPAWTVLAQASQLGLDGYVAVRTADIGAVEIRVGRDPTTVRALQQEGQWPPAPPEALAAASLADVLDMAAATSPLVDVGDEYDDPDNTYVGRVVAVRLDELDLLQVDADAVWAPEPTTFGTDGITWVAFGDVYNERLYALAGEPPSSRTIC